MRANYQRSMMLIMRLRKGLKPMLLSCAEIRRAETLSKKRDLMLPENILPGNLNLPVIR